MEEIKDTNLIENQIIDIKQINMSDLENQTEQNTNIQNDNNVKTNSNIDDETQNKLKGQLHVTKMIGFTVFIFMVIMYSAFIICDIYYGLNDKSCVNQNVERIDFTLKTFLLVRGFILLGLITEIFIGTCLITIPIIKLCSYLQLSLFLLVSFFLFAWNIVGAVVFWEYLDNSKCDNPVYNYTFASLVIVFVFSAINFTSSNSKNKN